MTPAATSMRKRTATTEAHPVYDVRARAYGLYVRGLNGFGVCCAWFICARAQWFWGLLLTSVLDFVAVCARICSTPKVEGPSTNSTEWPFGAFFASLVGNIPLTISRATRINEFADGG